MRFTMRAVAIFIFAILVTCHASHVAEAQIFSASFAAELQFQPAPFSLNATIFDLILGARVTDTAFTSHTQFDLLGLRSQQFSIDLLLGALTLHDRLLFMPALDFERNSLSTSVQMLGFTLALETILEDLGPPSPDINPGLIIEAGGRSSLGIGITSFTGFGVTHVIEDQATIYSCTSIELRCLGEPFPDDEYDRRVVKPFLFSEQAVRLDFLFRPVRLSITPLFTLSGLDRILLGASLRLNNPLVLFASQTTFSTTGIFALVRQQLIYEVQYGPVGWRSVTILSGAPIAFDSQTFKMSVGISGFSLYTTIVLSLAGLDEFRLGAGFQF